MRALYWFRKDVRRFWLWMALYAFLSLVRVWVVFYPIPPGLGTEVELPLLALIVFSLQVFAGLKLLAQVVQADPPLEPNAFWRTHPIGPWELLGAKLGFVALFILVPPLLLEGVFLARLGAPIGEVLSFEAENALRLLGVLAAAMVLAGLTRSQNRFFLSCLGTLVGLFVLASLGRAVSSQPDLERLLKPPSWPLALPVEVGLIWSRDLIGRLLLLVSSLALLPFLYGWRRPRLVAGGFVGSLLLWLACLLFWPWNLFEGKPAIDPAQVRPVVRLDSLNVHQPERLHVRVRTEDDAPGLIARTVSLEGELRVAGKRIPLQESAIFLGEWMWDLEELEKLAGVRLYSGGFSLNANGAYVRYEVPGGVRAGEVAQVSGQLEVQLFRCEEGPELALAGGSGFAGRIRSEVLSVERREAGEVELLVRQYSYGLLREGPRRVYSLYVLRNRSRREGLLPVEPEATRAKILLPQLVKELRRVVYQTAAWEESIVEVDEAWLSEADVLRVDFVYEGRMVKEARTRAAIREEGFEAGSWPHEYVERSELKEALEEGRMEALELVERGLCGEGRRYFNSMGKGTLRNLVLVYTTAQGSEAQLCGWFDQHRGKLVYDGEKKKFTPQVAGAGNGEDL